VFNHIKIGHYDTCDFRHSHLAVRVKRLIAQKIISKAVLIKRFSDYISIS
jgi:hypothetical protein